MGLNMYIYIHIDIYIYVYIYTYTDTCGCVRSRRKFATEKSLVLSKKSQNIDMQSPEDHYPEA